MRKALEGLKAREITFLSVVYTAVPEFDATSDFWRRGDYGIEQVDLGDRQLIALPPEYLLELMGEELMRDIIRCSRDSLKSMKRDAHSYKISFDTKKNTVKASRNE